MNQDSIAPVPAGTRTAEAPGKAPEKAQPVPARTEPAPAAEKKPAAAAPAPAPVPAEPKTAPVREAKKPQPETPAKAPEKAAPAPPVEEAKKTTPPLERVVKLAIPPNSAPFPLITAEQGEVVLICEKDTKTLHTFRFAQGKFLLIKSYPCIIGANGGDKKKAGDFATPKGIYFVMRYVPGNRLPGDYGTGAFILNYPNLIDRKDGKQGNGIWLHGHNNKKSMNDLLNTKGCIVVTNDVIKELSAVIRPQSTPIAIVDSLQFTGQRSAQSLSEEMKGFLASWRHSWETINTKKYLSFYSPDFVNSEGMNYEAFKNYKEKVNSSKKSIHVKVERTAVLLPQQYEGKLAVVRFDQKYQSNNFKSDSKKLLYLRKGKQGWQIIGESVF